MGTKITESGGILNRDQQGRFGDASYGWYENTVCFALRLAFRLNSQRRGAQLFAIASRA